MDTESFWIRCKQHVQIPARWRLRTLKLQSFVLLLFLSWSGLTCVADPSAVTMSPASLNFSQQTVGTTSNSSAVTLTNHLSTPVAISAITTTPEFAQTNNCGNSLSTGATCVIRVTFTPTGVGNRAGVLTVTDNASSTPQSTALNGTGAVVGLNSVVISPSSATIPLGLTRQFTATGHFKNGTISNLTTAVAWSSNNPGVFTFNNGSGSSGVASSVSQGSGTVTASIGSIVGSASLTIAPPAVVSLSLSPLSPSIDLGTRQQFSVTGYYTDHSSQTLTAGVTWQSSAPAIASVDQYGVAVAQSFGSTMITGQFGSFSASTVLRVVPELTSIVVSPNGATVQVGTTQPFTATGFYTDHSSQVLTSGVTWSTQSPSVATINSQGVAMAIAQGQTTVSAVFGSVSGSATISVGPPVLVSLSITPSNPSVAAGVIQQFQAIGTYSDHSTQPVYSQAWISSDTSVATINLAAYATAVAQGSTTITVSVYNGVAQPVTASTTLLVTAPAFKSLEILPDHPALLPGTSQQLRVEEIYTDGSTVDLTGPVTWASSNGSVASITNTGMLSTVSQGVTTITASSSDLNLTATTPIEVYASGQARFAYVSNYRDDTIGLYLLDGTSGQLFPAATTFLGGGNGPVAVASDPSGQFLYTANKDSGSISALTIDSITGSLVPISNTPTTWHGPMSLAVHPSGRYLFVADHEVTVYGIASNGSTSPIWQQLGATYPVCVTLDPTGTLVYATTFYPGSISGYTFDAQSGSLTAMPGSPFSAGLYLEFAIVHPSGKFAYVTNANGQSVSVLAIDPASGALTLQGDPVPVQQAPSFLAFDRSGNYLYVTNNFSNTISGFAVDQVTGNLTPLIGSPFTAIGGEGPASISVDSTNQYMYVANEGTNTVGILAIDAAGGLSLKYSVPTGTQPLSMVLVK